MENAPDIMLFWWFVIALMILIMALMTAGIILLKIGRKQGVDGKRFLGKICMTLSIASSVPILFVVGYVLYLYIG